MSILINGMEMPKEGFVEILICDDGTVQQTGQSYRVNGNDCYMPYVGEMPKMFTAVHVQPHGRLVDADVLKKKRHWTDDFYETEYVEVEDIDAAPTIIPASE